LEGHAAGVVGAFVNAMQSHSGSEIVLVEYSEHTLSQEAGADAEAVTYVQLNINGQRYCGVGLSTDILEASLRAILSAINQPLNAKI
jgi:2-isopropylmalate synthase